MFFDHCNFHFLLKVAVPFSKEKETFADNSLIICYTSLPGMVAHDFNTSTRVRGMPGLNCISQEGRGYVLRPCLSSNNNNNNNNNNNSNSNNNFKMYNIFWSYLSPSPFVLPPPTLFSRVSPCRQGATCLVLESIVWWLVF